MSETECEHEWHERINWEGDVVAQFTSCWMEWVCALCGDITAEEPNSNVFAPNFDEDDLL